MIWALFARPGDFNAQVSRNLEVICQPTRNLSYVLSTKNYDVDENDQQPCVESSGGFLEAGQAFVDAMVAKGAKKILADRKLVTLTGSPS